MQSKEEDDLTNLTHPGVNLFQIMGNMVFFFVLESSQIDGHEVAPSGLREDPMSIEGYFDWIDSLSRDAHKCGKRCFDSSKVGILCIAL